MQDLPRYQLGETYRWNYDHAPDPVEIEVPEFPGEWTFIGMPVGSPLGIPAGPLLNGKWVLYYASLGVDVLTYKTTRSSSRDCYPLPNLQPVRTGMLTGGESSLPATDDMRGSWAVSFGMPSSSPDVWRKDVEWTRGQLADEKVLSVSVVGTVQPGWTTEQLAADYAQCAAWAVQSGADCVETNFSCPNVSTCDGQLFQNPADAVLVAGAVRDAIGKTPYLVKIGHVGHRALAEQLVRLLSPTVDAFAMTNSVAATVTTPAGTQLFDGERRGICGDATRQASLAQAALFAEVIRETDADVKLVGVGGASTAEHVRDYLNAGCESVHIATAAMTNPVVGIRIREAWSGDDVLRHDARGVGETKVAT